MEFEVHRPLPVGSAQVQCEQLGVGLIDVLFASVFRDLAFFIQMHFELPSDFRTSGNFFVCTLNRGRESETKLSVRFCWVDGN